MDNATKIDIGKRIDNVRLNIMKIDTKEEIASLFGISGQHLGNIIRGKIGISIELLIKICEVTKVSADYILFGNENILNDNEIKLALSDYNEEQIDLAFEIVKTIINKVKK